MGERKKKTFEEEALDALNGGAQAGPSFEEQAQQALAAKDDPKDVAATTDHAEPDTKEPDSDADDASSAPITANNLHDTYLQWVLSEGGKPLLGNGLGNDIESIARPYVEAKLGGPIGEGRFAASLGRAVGGAASSGLQSANEGKDVWQALLDAGVNAGESVGLGKVADMVGAGAGALKGFFRRKQLSPTVDAVRNLQDKFGSDYVPTDLGQAPDELGITNRFLPQSVENMRDRAQTVAGNFGRSQDAAIAARDAEQAAAMGGAKRDWGNQIANDMFKRADAAEFSPLGDAPERAMAMNRVGMQAAGLAGAGNPVDDLQKLRGLKTTYENQRYPGATKGTNESRMGVAHGLAADEARQYLDQQMSGANDPDIYRQFLDAKSGFGQAETVRQLADDQNARVLAGNAGGGGMGAAARSALGYAFGGPTGAVVGALGGGRMNDMALSGAGNVARNTQDLANVVGRGSSALTTEYNGASENDLTGQMRGHLLPQAVEMVLDRNPEVLGPYAQIFLEAKKNDTMSGTLYRLEMTDDTFRRQYLPQLQSLTIEP